METPPIRIHALLAIVLTLAPTVRAQSGDGELGFIDTLKVGSATYPGTADQSGDGWSWNAAARTLTLANASSIDGGIDFTADRAYPPVPNGT